MIHTQQYIIKHNPKSVLCLPLINQNKLTGILYLENKLIEAAFTAERLEVLKMLSAQLAISLENSLLYENLEQKVADRTIKLEKANKAKSEFLSSMSHELRTPLNGILGYAQILKRAKNLEETQVSGLNTIYNSGNHLLTLINDILDLSKIEAGKLEIYPENIHFVSFIDDLALKVVAVEDKAEQRRITAYKGKTQTALIVDDNGKNSIKLADKANIIFMDLVMPVMNGFEAVQTIRKNLKQIPIIAISANVFEADKQKSLQAGCNAFLPKPIEEQQLFNTLVEYLDLKWVYEQEQIIEKETLIPPPTKNLEKLYELAMMGDMREIKEFAMQLDEEYSVFANKVIELAAGFEDELILNLVEEYM